jgi:hypothetical protein
MAETFWTIYFDSNNEGNKGDGHEKMHFSLD